MARTPEDMCKPGANVRVGFLRLRGYATPSFFPAPMGAHCTARRIINSVSITSLLKGVLLQVLRDPATPPRLFFNLRFECLGRREFTVGEKR